MSDPGPCTPRRYDPNVKILPPAAVAAASESPRCSETVRTNFLTSVASRSRTTSLWSGKGWVSSGRGVQNDELVNTKKVW